jgi:hypothetical protein
VYVKHLQEYLGKFTEGNNGRQGNAVSDAKIYIMTSKGYLEEIKRGRAPRFGELETL